jgi:hypothetical protein
MISYDTIDSDLRICHNTIISVLFVTSHLQTAAGVQNAAELAPATSVFGSSSCQIPIELGG